MTVSPLRRLARVPPFQGRPLPKGFVQAMLQDPEYRPVPVEQCRCAFPTKTGKVNWRRCTLLGQLDGTLPDSHVRIGRDDYLWGFLGIAACVRLGEKPPKFRGFD